MLHHAGFCPTCFQREGPLKAHGLLYWYCGEHHVHWTTPARERGSSPEEFIRVQELCQKTVRIVHAKTWRPSRDLYPQPVNGQ